MTNNTTDYVFQTIRDQYNSFNNLSEEEKVKHFKREVNKHKLKDGDKFDFFNTKDFIFTDVSRSTVKSASYYNFLSSSKSDIEKFNISKNVLTYAVSELFYKPNNSSSKSSTEKIDFNTNVVETKHEYDYLAFQDIVENFLIIPISHSVILPMFFKLRDEFREYIFNLLNKELKKAGLYEKFHDKPSHGANKSCEMYEYINKHEIIYKEGLEKENFYRLAYYLTILIECDSVRGENRSNNILQSNIVTLPYLVFLNKKLGINITPYFYIYNCNICFSLFDKNCDMTCDDVDIFDVINNHTFLTYVINSDYDTDNLTKLIKSSPLIGKIIEKKTFDTDLSFSTCDSFNSMMRSNLNGTTIPTDLLNNILNSRYSSLERFIVGSDIKQFKRNINENIKDKCMLVDMKKLCDITKPSLGDSSRNIQSYLKEFGENSIILRASDVDINNKSIYYSNNVMSHNSGIFFKTIFKYFELSPQRLSDGYYSGDLIEDLKQDIMEMVYGS